MDIQTLQIWSVIVSWILGIGGLATAFFTAYWAYKSRIEPYKKEMYDRQIEATAECLDAIVDLQHEIEKVYIKLGRPLNLDDKSIKVFEKTIETKYRKLKTLLLKWSVILPEYVYFPFVEYLTTLEYTIGHRILIEGWAGATYHQNSPWRNCANNFLIVIKEIRRFLGADKLREELNKTFKNDDEHDINPEINPLAYLISDDYRPTGQYFEGFQLARELLERIGGNPDNLFRN